LIQVVGAGLAGSLLALELSAQGCSVELIGPDGGDTATGLSYGLLPPTAAGAWRRLERRHGRLGLRRRWLQLRPRGLPLQAWQVDPQRFGPLVAAALQRAGVHRTQQTLTGPKDLQALQRQGPVVLCCGASCRTLAPQLEPRMRCSWAGVLELRDPAHVPRRCRWGGVALLPERFSRLELERRSPALSQEAWIVDAGLVPTEAGVIAGQISLIRPQLEAGDAPDPAVMEDHLRQELARRWPQLVGAAGRYRQAPVSFCSDGIPLNEAVQPGLWVLAGFSGAFGQVPDAARQLAAQIAATES